MLKHRRGKKQSVLSIKLNHFWQQLRGVPMEVDLTPYRKILAKIEAISLQSAGERELQKMSEDLRRRARQGEPPAKLLVEAYALVREACRRVLGLRPFDVQVMAAAAMHQGKLAEMQTGEGKTLTAVFPAYLNALSGRGVHIMTANDYLARRDAGWMGPVYRFLGLSVGVVQEKMPAAQRQRAYQADITYLTAKEAGFDYLRDQIRFDKKELVHRPFHYALVDEADFILIDEARVPLVIAGETPEPAVDPLRMAEIVRRLEPGVHYETDENRRNVHLTESGIRRAEELLHCQNLYDPENLLLFSALNVALHARVLLQRDVDYIVRQGKIELVDEFTGRVADRRRWPHGIQTAVEAREGLTLQAEGRILGSITLQHFLRLYPRMAGMTATAQPAAMEFKEFYDLTVVVIPPHRRCLRLDEPDVVFTHRAAKMEALVQEIARVHAEGRPVLVGTASVAESESLAAALKQVGISCRVLNARRDEQEAHIVAQAGKLEAVTISTNMAGRGTDIRLGGEDESQKERVKALGGLYVIGTNRHESRRVDQQLRGRAGRQGDPGSSRFFVSLEDDLMERYNVRSLIPAKHLPPPQAEPINDPLVRREIARAQRIIEGQNFEIRKTLWGYSAIVEEQRKTMQARRRQVLVDTETSFLEATAPRHYAKLHAAVGGETLRQVERTILLYHMDREWSDHLAHIADIREGIHLYRFGGRIPLAEFQQRANGAFVEMQQKVDDDILKTFRSLRVTAGSIDLDRAGLRGPASTWTYLINDNPFGGMGLALVASRNLGFAAGAGIVAILYWPVTLALLIGRWLSGRAKRR
jgi:preprotein translocase subunit SecA